MPKVIKGGGGPYLSTLSSTLSSTRPAPRKRVIDREVVEAKSEAERIVEAAEAKAEAILEAAEAEAQSMREAGYTEGRETALAEFSQHWVIELHRLKAIEAELEPLYITLVKDCCEAILGEELRQHPEAIVPFVRRALVSARQQREIIIRLNPEDLRVVARQKARLMQVLARAGDIDLREDPSIGRGGCQIITEQGSIDAGLDRQLEALETALMDELSDAES